MLKFTRHAAALVLLALLVLGCTGGSGQATSSPSASSAEITPTGITVTYRLTTNSGHHGMAFVGIGGEIDGVNNPDLRANPGDKVEIILINGDGVTHDFQLDAFNATSGPFTVKGKEVKVEFIAGAAGTYEYYCSIAGHRQAGMFGNFIVGDAAPVAVEGADIIHHPGDLPAPLGERGPQTVRVSLETIEVTGKLSDKAAYTYFTFNGTVPGPFLRVRLGDTVELTLKNQPGSHFAHSIDLHAVNGPGGGHMYTETLPGEENVFTFTPLASGIYVYHCATPSVPYHITNGMYGLILVEPAEGLPAVDREYYVMQGEMYTAQPYGSAGMLDFDAEKMSAEQPEFYVFNGADGALTRTGNELTAHTGETVRIFFGVGGPNKTSSFHIIGEIFDRVYTFGSLTSPPLTDVQTVTVPAGGAVMVELMVDVPGTYYLVDHALSRAERGLIGHLVVEGEENPAIIHDGPAE